MAKYWQLFAGTTQYKRLLALYHCSDRRKCSVNGIKDYTIVGLRTRLTPDCGHVQLETAQQLVRAENVAWLQHLRTSVTMHATSLHLTVPSSFTNTILVTPWRFRYKLNTRSHIMLICRNLYHTHVIGNTYNKVPSSRNSETEQSQNKGVVRKRLALRVNCVRCSRLKTHTQKNTVFWNALKLKNHLTQIVHPFEHSLSFRVSRSSLATN